MQGINQESDVRGVLRENEARKHSDFEFDVNVVLVFVDSGIQDEGYVQRIVNHLAMALEREDPYTYGDVCSVILRRRSCGCCVMMLRISCILETGYKCQR